MGGNIPIDTTICLEFLPQQRRFLLTLLSIFQPLGVVVCSAVAAGLIPKYSCYLPDGKTPPACNSVAAGQPCCTKESNMGWRYTLYTVGAITLLIFIVRSLLFNFRESPKFLVYRGKNREAIKVLHQIAKFNRRTCTLTIEELDSIESDSSTVRNDESPESAIPLLGGCSPRYNTVVSRLPKLDLARYKQLFGNFNTSRLTILVWLAYIFDFMAFSVAGSFLPKILLIKNSSIHVSLAQTYVNYVIIYLPGVVGVGLGSLMYAVPMVGRKWGMVGSSALMGASLFLFSTVNTEASNVGLNLMEYFFQSMYNAILYGWTPEVYAAPIRGTACGVASFWGRLFSIVSPIIAQYILPVSLNGVLYLAGGAALLSSVAILLIPDASIGYQP